MRVCLNDAPFSQDFPSTLAIVGRLSPPQIWSYVSKLRQSASREIHVISFAPAHGDQTQAYNDLFEYLKSRNRCGLVAGFSTKIKDFYVIPLDSKKPVPDVLIPFNGPGQSQLNIQSCSNQMCIAYMIVVASLYM